eukprot:scaffold13221_cov63-Phaeocystis_antarctica.AAC.3
MNEFANVDLRHRNRGGALSGRTDPAVGLVRGWYPARKCVKKCPRVCEAKTTPKGLRMGNK